MTARAAAATVAATLTRILNIAFLPIGNPPLLAGALNPFLFSGPFFSRLKLARGSFPPFLDVLPSCLAALEVTIVRRITTSELGQLIPVKSHCHGSAPPSSDRKSV